MNRYEKIHFAQVPERVSTTSVVVLIIGNSKSNHVGAQGTFNPNWQPATSGKWYKLEIIAALSSMIPAR